MTLLEQGDGPVFDRRRTDLQDRLSTADLAGETVAVVGEAGSGKSSLIKAGLIPALWQGKLAGSEKWFIVDMQPGGRPLDNLEIALTRIAADQAGNNHHG